MSGGTDCTPVVVAAKDGAAIGACAHGGHLLSWRPAGPGTLPAADQLWLSPTARCGPGEAIRGGVPVIFPQFAGRGPLPKHGLARDRAWVLDPGPDAAAEAVIVASLTDDDATRAIWPHAFALALRMVATGRGLTLTMRVTNTGADAFAFSAALHAYLAAGPAARLHGLDGATAEDNAAGRAELTLPGHPLTATDPRDVAVRHLAADVRLSQPGRSAITVRREGFDDLVVWNPGPDHGLADVPAGPADFVCLEPAQLTPVALDPGRTWTASATFEHDAAPDHPEAT